MNRLYEYRIGRFSMPMLVERLRDTKLLRHWRQRRGQIFPLSIAIETTSKCTHRCSFCPSHHPGALDRGFGFMPFERYQKIIDESVRYGKRRKIFLYKDGEPILHPDLGRMIRYAKEKDAADVLLVTTNGTVLFEKEARDIILSGLDELMISIDAASKETFERIKGSSTYETVIENTRSFFQVREEIGSKTPYTRVKLVVCDENRHEIDDFIAMWEPVADEVFIVRDINTWDGSSSVVNSVVGESETYSGVQAQLQQDNPRQYPCDRLWYQFEVNYNGVCSPCVCDWNEKYVLGNIDDQSIYSMWHGDRLYDLRKSHIEGRQKEIELCRNCDRWKLKNMGDWYEKNPEKALERFPEKEIS